MNFIKQIIYIKKHFLEACKKKKKNEWERVKDEGKKKGNEEDTKEEGEESEEYNENEEEENELN